MTSWRRHGDHTRGDRAIHAEQKQRYRVPSPEPEVLSAVMAETADALPSHGDALGLGGEGDGDEEEDAQSAQEEARASGEG